MEITICSYALRWLERLDLNMWLYIYNQLFDVLSNHSSVTFAQKKQGALQKEGKYDQSKMALHASH